MEVFSLKKDSQILTQRAQKQRTVLRHKGQPASEDVKAYVTDFETIDSDTARLHVDDPSESLCISNLICVRTTELCPPEECLKQRALPGTRASYNSDLLARVDLERDIFQYQWQAFPVRQVNIFELYLALLRP